MSGTLWDCNRRTQLYQCIQNVSASIHTDNAVVQSGLMKDATDACLAHCNGVGNVCALLQALLIGIDTMGTASIAVLCNSAGSNKTLWYKLASGWLWEWVLYVSPFLPFLWVQCSSWWTAHDYINTKWNYDRQITKKTEPFIFWTDSCSIFYSSKHVIKTRLLVTCFIKLIFKLSVLILPF